MKTFTTKSQPDHRTSGQNHSTATDTKAALPLLRGASKTAAPKSQTNATHTDHLRALSLNQTLSPTCAPSIVPDKTDSRIQARVDCPCIPLNATGLQYSNKYDANADCLIHDSPGETFCYPATYGFDGCQAYDQNLPPSCNKQGFPGNPDWCFKSFCYVDKDNCKDTDYFPSTYFDNEGLHYSYETCGNENTFLQSLNDQLKHSMMEPVAALERHLIGICETINSTAEPIRNFISDGGNVEQSCSHANSCDPILEGEENDCWGGEVDFNNVNVVLHQNRERQSIPSDVDFLSCLSRPLKSAFLNIAETEHRDTDRTAYLYYGDQNTVGLISYPELDFCSSQFDARFRPWYAAAVSGPKDVVVIIDNSGSMEKSNRLSLAEAATKRVIDTLTWADRVSLMTFNGGVAKVFEDKLVASDETNIEKIKNWVYDNFKANGGTDFMAPLEKGYQILKNNQDANDQPTCSQAILFLTDGQAEFDENKMNQLIEGNPDVVVFSYGLSASANQDALQKMSCMTNGIYYPVPNEAELPDRMSSYYEYFASLQDSGISWTRYTDAFSGKEMISGCSATYQFDNNGMVPPDLVGVACMDLNILVDPDTLKSCENNAYDQFIDQIFREATQCRSTKSKVEDLCELQHMRRQVHKDSVCPDQVSIESCSFEPQPIKADYSHLTPARFQDIEMSGCSIQEYDCQIALPNPDANDKDNNSSPFSPALIGAMGAVGGLMLICGGVMWYRRRSAQGNNNRPVQPIQEYPAPILPPSAPDSRYDYR